MKSRNTENKFLPILHNSAS